jgi:hypothetical protein
MTAGANVEAINDSLHEVLAQLEIVSTDRRAAIEKKDEIHRRVAHVAEREDAHRGESEH